MQEQKLKRRLFVFLLIAKVLIIGLIFFHWDTGGFSRGEMFALVGLILPLFTVYTSVIWKDFAGNPYEEESTARTGKKFKAGFRYGVWFFFTFYVLIVAWLISMKPSGDLSFPEVGTAISLTESAFGVYLGQIVATLFRSSSES